jgi:hypothetical protein
LETPAIGRHFGLPGFRRPTRTLDLQMGGMRIG